MELTFEDLIFMEPSSASSNESNDDIYQQPGAFFPSSPSTSYTTTASRTGRSQRKGHKATTTTSSRRSHQLPALCSSSDEHQDPYERYYSQCYLTCPGAAHRRHDGSHSTKFFVDPHTGAGKCPDPDCTWGFFNGSYIITDFRGFAYSTESSAEPVTFLLGDGATRKHVRLATRTR